MFPIMDSIMLFDSTILYLFKDTINKYDYFEIKDQIKQHPFGMLLHPDKLIYYPIGWNIMEFLKMQRTFQYVLKYFMIDVHSYPDSEWYRNPEQLKFGTEEQLSHIWSFLTIQPWFVGFGWPIAIIGLTMLVCSHTDACNVIDIFK